MNKVQTLITLHSSSCVRRGVKLTKFCAILGNSCVKFRRVDDKGHTIPRPWVNHLFICKGFKGTLNHILRLPCDNGEKKYQAVVFPGTLVQ